MTISTKMLTAKDAGVKVFFVERDIEKTFVIIWSSWVLFIRQEKFPNICIASFNDAATKSIRLVSRSELLI